MVLLLLKFGADVSLINGEGRTPLQMADDDEVQQLIKGSLFTSMYFFDFFIIYSCKSADCNSDFIKA